MTEQNCSENAVWTPANVVTLIRILFIPVFVVAIITPWPEYFSDWDEAELFKPWIAAAIFAILSCTDALDGYLARSRGEVTNFGKFIDPLADKILVAAALLALVELQVLPSWVALIILAREFIVSGLRMLVATHGVVVAASWYGKAKTVFQIIAILLFIVKESPILTSLHEQMELALYLFSWFIMLIALVLTVVSMIDYFVKCAPILGFSSKSEPTHVPVETEVVDLGPQTEKLATQVVDAARDLGLKISTAESCTGGLIGGALTAIPGSSDVVEGGIISYSNDVKAAVLGVSENDLAIFGAVSSEVAEAMAFGSRKACGTDVAVAVTGVAGPGGGSEEKPVGTVWFGLAYGDTVRSEVMRFDGDRVHVRSATVRHALGMLLEGVKATRV